jgi:hypothetical protein
MNRRSSLTSLHRDARGFVAGLIVKSVVVFALLGLVLYEGGQVVVAQIKAHTAARAGAQVGANSFHSTGNHAVARAAAEAATAEKWSGARLTSFDIDQEGAVTVTARVEANTVVLSRLSFTRPWGVQYGTEETARQT